MSARRPDRRRRVAVVTGTRAEYGLLQTVLEAIREHAALDLRLVVTGMHLLPRFGRTERIIAADGWRIDARVSMQRGDDGPLDQARGLARGVDGIARFLQERGAEIVLVLGDRIEALAGALAGVTTGRIVAHIHGGDVAPGDCDDSQRHAITKLAHVHFVASREAQRRVIRLGEAPRRVHCAGAVGLDRLRALLASAPPRDGRSGEALIVYHALGRSAAREQRVATTLLESVRDAGLRRAVLYPNSDRGHAGVLRAVERHARTCGPDEVSVLRSLPRDEYLRRLLHADVLVGNSSSGIIEAPLAGTPSVNVGPRQAGRQRGGPSALSCGESERAIRAALRRALRMKPRRGGRSVYGDGRAGRRIAQILARLPLHDGFRRKVITY